MGLIFRNDDVNKNSHLGFMQAMYDHIKSLYPDSEIWSCVTIFSKKNDQGAIYPNPPFKDRDLEFFMNVDQYFGEYKAPYGVITASHGLWHVDHSKMTSEFQYASILSSCNILKTDLFVPPFNKCNEDTQRICDDLGVRLVKFEEGWKSLEHNAFDPSHELWYFHSWKWTPQTFKEHLLNAVNSKVLG